MRRAWKCRSRRRQPAPRADQSLDEYFDRLDVAFAHARAEPAAPVPASQRARSGAGPSCPRRCTPSPHRLRNPRRRATGKRDRRPVQAVLRGGAGRAGRRASIRIPDEIERIRRRQYTSSDAGEPAADFPSRQAGARRPRDGGPWEHAASCVQSGTTPVICPFDWADASGGEMRATTATAMRSDHRIMPGLP